jgi:fructose-specific component phosphotransferase system IIB-like protein
MTGELADLEGQTPSSTRWRAVSPSASVGSGSISPTNAGSGRHRSNGCMGTSPGVHPITDMVLSHKHPDDYGQVVATLEEIRRTSGAFSTRHRIIDTHGEVHHVVVVGDHLFDDDGAVIGTHGFYVDVSPSIQQAHDEFVTEAVVEIAEARGGIEQTKGMLMLIYRINADSAAELALAGDQHQVSCVG